MRTEKIVPRNPPKTKRLGGGPSVPIDTYNYVTQQQQGMARAEGLAKCSLATLLNKLAMAQLDLVALTRIKPKKKFAVVG